MRKSQPTKHNAAGQLTSGSDPDSAYAYAFDGEGRTTSVDNSGTPNVPHVVLSDQYDANGNRTQLSATIAGTADFLNSYSFDALNQLTQLVQQGQSGGNAVATKGANLTYDADGQLATIFRTNFFGVGPAPPSVLHFATKGAAAEVEARVRIPEIESMSPKNGSMEVDSASTARCTSIFKAAGACRSNRCFINSVPARESPSERQVNGPL